MVDNIIQQNQRTAGPYMKEYLIPLQRNYQPTNIQIPVQQENLNIHANQPQVQQNTHSTNQSIMAA
jgi:hypothetical protein